MAEHPQAGGWREDDEALPLAELRAAWGELTPPAEAPEPDAPTRAVVDWLRAAWEEVEVPEARVPSRSRTGSTIVPRPRRLRRVALRLAAAAALLVLAAVALDRARDARRPDGDTEIAERDPGTDSSKALAPVRVASIAPDRVEMRSGPVRLILLTDETSTGRGRSARQGDRP